MDPSADMQACPACGTPNRKTNKFCVECGAPLPIDTSSDAAPTLIGAIPAPEPSLPAAPPPLDENMPTIEPPPLDENIPTIEPPPLDENMPTMIGRLDPSAAAQQAADTPPPKPGRRKKTSELPSKQADTSATSGQPTRPIALPESPAASPDAQTMELEPPPDMALPPSDPPAPGMAQPAKPAGNNRMLLIGGGIIVALLILACVAFGTIRMIAGMIPPTVTPRTGRTPTSEVAQPTSTPNGDLGILKTAQVEQDETATAEAQQPTEEATTAPTEEATAEPTATAEATVEPSPELVSASFSEQEASDARKRHDAELKTYRRLLFETFEEGNRTKARWNHGQEGRRLVNNRYELTIDLASTYNFDVWKQQPDSLGDSYTVEMEARFLSTTTFSRIGITFDVQEDSTKNWLYLIGSDGNWYVFRNEERVGSGQLPDKFAINPDTPYVLWVWRLPSGVLFFFNGELVAFVTSDVIGDDYPTGKVGVVGVSGSAEADVPVTVVVDNFLVARK